MGEPADPGAADAVVRMTLWHHWSHGVDRGDGGASPTRSWHTCAAPRIPRARRVRCDRAGASPLSQSRPSARRKARLWEFREAPSPIVGRPSHAATGCRRSSIACGTAIPPTRSTPWRPDRDDHEDSRSVRRHVARDARRPGHAHRQCEAGRRITGGVGAREVPPLQYLSADEAESTSTGSGGNERE